MPSCGKSTIAKALAQHLNKQVVDLDAKIVERYGSIPAFFVVDVKNFPISTKLRSTLK